MDPPSFDPLAQHAANASQLLPTDIVVYGYPGSGASLLGNLLLESGLGYLDPYTETLESRASVASSEARRSYRTRLSASAHVDGGGPRNVSRDRLWVKTHEGPEAFPVVPTTVVILVRDPRDAVRSYYEFRRTFGKERETRPFALFLRHGPDGSPAATDWARFHEAWFGLASAKLVSVRFEDLKADMPAAFIELVRRTTSVELDPDMVARACARSSFSSMRAHEDAVADDDRRLMRRGLVDEWREWWSAEYASTFLTPEVTAGADRFGYRIDVP